MKEIEWKLLSELMKDSRRSDRQLARALGVSQPTITRTRTKLEKPEEIKATGSGYFLLLKIRKNLPIAYLSVICRLIHP